MEDTTKTKVSQIPFLHKESFRITKKKENNGHINTWYYRIYLLKEKG